MKLYHGTSLAAAERALRTGLMPRSANGGHKGNWEHNQADSRPDCVYLTTVYAPYFALTASSPEDGYQAAAILEIDTDKLVQDRLLPDEDALEQSGRRVKDGVPGDMRERTNFYRDRLTNYQYLWEQSVKALGTCAYRGIIKPKAITRVVRWDWKDGNSFIVRSAMDPSITLMNYQIMKSKYEAITQYLMGDAYDEEALVGGAFYREVAAMDKSGKFAEGYKLNREKRYTERIK